MIRQIVLDTETTGLKVQDKHKIVEFGAVELIDRKITGRKLHFYINPERDIPEEVISVHGITNEKVANSPKFNEVAKEIVDFIKGAEILAHNADFDLNFLNNELKLADMGSVWDYVHKVTDTLFLSKSLNSEFKKHSLDELCKRYEVDNTNREFHGALLDSELLAEVYLKMTEGKTDLDIKPLIEQTNWVRPEIVKFSLEIPSLELTTEEKLKDCEMKLFIAKSSKNLDLMAKLEEVKKSLEEEIANKSTHKVIDNKNQSELKKNRFSFS